MESQQRNFVRMRLVQTRKGLYDASFQLLDNDGRLTGSVSFSGSPLRYMGDFHAVRNGRPVEMSPCGRRAAKKAADGRFVSSPSWGFAISGGQSGVMFFDQTKGLFRPSIGWRTLILGDAEHRCYTIGLGKDGTRSLVYRGDACVAEIRTPSRVTDDLYRFDILCLDAGVTDAALCLACHIWASVCYRAGETYRGWRETRYVTTEKELLAKCADSPFGWD